MIEYRVEGEGPAVLLLHGAMGGYDQSSILGRAVLGESGYRRIAVSRPGYLGTPLAGGESPQQQADLCAATLDELGEKEAAVIAISGGGPCALQFALRHPQRCRALVLISACCTQLSERIPLRFHFMTWTAKLPPVVRFLQRGAAARAEALAQTLDDDPYAGQLVRELMTGMFDRIAERLPGTRNDIQVSRAPMDYPVEQISAPILLIQGLADEVVPPNGPKSLHLKVPLSQALWIEGGTHMALFTHRLQIAQRVQELLLLPSRTTPM